MSRKALVFIPISLVLIVADQLTKWWVYTHLELHRGQIEVIPGIFSIIHVQNPGAAFSLMRDFEYRIWVFIAFGIIAVGILVDLWRRLPRSDWFVSLCLALILSGAVGNFIDRVTKQSVTDFLRVYTDGLPALHDWLAEKGLMTEWPTWNIADATLVVGVGLFLVHYLFIEEKEDEDEDEDEDEGEGDHPTEEAAPGQGV